MTQKSLARQQRDKAAETHKTGSTCWDDLNNIHNACLYSINNATARLDSLYSIEGVKNYIQNGKEAAINIRGVIDDRARMLERLQAIHQKHASMTGGVTDEDPDALVKSMRLVAEYEEWNSHVEMAFLPSVEYLVSEFSDAYQRMLTANAVQKAKEQQPNQA